MHPEDYETDHGPVNFWHIVDCTVRGLGSSEMTKPHGPSGRFLSLATFLFLGLSGVAVAAEDILGLRIGVSPEEARQSLQRINPKFKITEGRDQARNALHMLAAVPGETIVLEFTETQPRAFFIGRSVVFQPGQRPTKEALKNDLIAKYTKPTSMDIGRPWGDSFSWVKASPKPSFAPAAYGLRGCAPFPTGQSQWSAGAGASPVFLYFTTVECDKLMRASIGSAFNEDPKIAATLGISITDYALARSDPRNPANLAAEAERKKIEEAGKTKAKL